MASLQSLSSAVLESSKRLIYYKSLVHFMTFAAASVSIVASGWNLYVLAIVALGSETICWFLGLSASNKKSLGQELLRLNILKQSFGSEMPIDTAYLKMKVSASEYKAASKFENPDYYSTKHENPKQRLLNILQESCFWSQHLYLACRDRSIKISVGVASSILLIIACSISLVELDDNYTAPRLAILFLTFLPLWDGISRAISFNLAASRLTIIDHRMESSISDEASVLAIFADYNVITSSTPLIPQGIYEKNSSKLNELWSERSG